MVMMAPHLQERAREGEMLGRSGERNWSTYTNESALVCYALVRRAGARDSGRSELGRVRHRLNGDGCPEEGQEEVGARDAHCAEEGEKEEKEVVMMVAVMMAVEKEGREGHLNDSCPGRAKQRSAAQRSAARGAGRVRPVARLPARLPARPAARRRYKHSKHSTRQYSGVSAHRAGHIPGRGWGRGRLAGPLAACGEECPHARVFPSGPSPGGTAHGRRAPHAAAARVPHGRKRDARPARRRKYKQIPSVFRPSVRRCRFLGLSLSLLLPCSSGLVALSWAEHALLVLLL